MGALYQKHLGKKRGALDAALTELVGEQTDYLVYRGLGKLLQDRSTFEVASPIDPRELREKVFTLSAAHHPVPEHGDPLHTFTRAAALAQVGLELKMRPEDVEEALYADLEEEQRLTESDPMAPEALLARYNVALAQAVLLRATKVTLTLAPGDAKRMRQLFRFIKFYRLMHTLSGSRQKGYTVVLDGPMSLFQHTGKYGLQLAEFLPALLLCRGWSMVAELQWGKERKPATFTLTSEDGLVSHYPDKGVYVTDEERHFQERFAALESQWDLEREGELFDLGGEGVLVPDFVARNRLDGREALIEVLGFWRKGYLESRVELLRKHGPKNLLLLVSHRLRSTAEEQGELPGHVVFFKDVIPSKDVLAWLRDIRSE
jgi:hypothetical protein